MRRTQRYKSLMDQYDGNRDSVNYYLHKKYKMPVFTWQGEKEMLMSPLDSLEYYKRYLQAGFMAMNPLNGQIKAWVGGPNYKFFKFDHVRQGKRQPGSTFKPIVYTAAIDQGYSPCYPRPDVATTFPAVAGRARLHAPELRGQLFGPHLHAAPGPGPLHELHHGLAGDEAHPRDHCRLRQAPGHHLARRCRAVHGLRHFRLQHLRAVRGLLAPS